MIKGGRLTARRARYPACWRRSGCACGLSIAREPKLYAMPPALPPKDQDEEAPKLSERVERGPQHEMAAA
jgi:hypothetical protein